MDNQNKPSTPGNTTPVLILGASIILATSIVFAALYIGRTIKSVAAHGLVCEAAATSQSADEDDEEDARQTDVSDQFIDEAQRQSTLLKFAEASNVRFTENRKVMALDFTYKPAAGGTVQEWHNLEFTQDEQGRYVGHFAVGKEKFTITIY